MPVLDYSASSPVVRRAPTGTLSTEIGNSMFYSKSAIRRLQQLSRTSLDSQVEAASIEDLDFPSLSRSNVTSRFPKLQECAHFHYERVELGKIEVSMYESGAPGGCLASVSSEEHHKSIYHGVEEDGGDYFFTLNVNSNAKTWLIRRTYRDFRKFDRQLHKCVYDRKFSQLLELGKLDGISLEHLENLKSELRVYLARFSQVAGNLINCAPVLNWLELDNRGYRLIASDDSAINTPAIAAVHVVKRYVPQAGDELTLEVGDMISVIDMPPSDESIWWRGKTKQLDVGFFPSDCVEVIGGGKMPPNADQSSRAPVLRKRGKLIAFFRSFLSTRPTRRRLKESGILKERVYGCDLGEHLLNTGQKVPAVLIHCTSFIEEHGTVDGIYRLSGVTSNIQRLRLEFDAEKVPNLLEEIYMQDIHSVASVLKLYFRELPNPILTYQLYDKFVDAVQSSDEVRLLKIHDVVNQLPPPHFRTLEYLMRHLARVASSADKTGMNCKNLAIVWAPNLLRSSETENGVEALKGVGVCAIAVEYLVKYADLIFSNRLQTSSLLTRTGNAAKSNRPKSLAVSTPTKLLSLDEARALTRPNLDQKFIVVGAGPDNLPKYHTVIDLPKNRGKKRSGSVKSSQKSPSTWRNIFVSKNRKQTWPQRSPLDFSNPLGSPIPTSTLEEEPRSGGSKRRKLRSAQSAESLSIGHFMRHNSSSSDSARHLTRNEPSLLRTPVSSTRRSHSVAHNRSISHDSYFEELFSDGPRNIIDVIQTIPYLHAENGVLVKLSIDEESQHPNTPSSKHRFYAANSNAIVKTHSGYSVRPKLEIPVQAEVHPIRYKKLNRTLSPEFLRKHRELEQPQQSGVKRSLSASPKAVQHRLDPDRVSVRSCSSVERSLLIRKESAGGRKSFRRSTSEDELLPVESPPEIVRSLIVHDSVMDVSSHEEAKTFESTEMELFDEICAEIYGKEREILTDQNVDQGVTNGGVIRTDSLQDIAEICEEEETLSPRPLSIMFPPLATTPEVNVDPETPPPVELTDSCSSFGLHSFFGSPLSFSGTSSVFLPGSSSRPSSLLSTNSQDSESHTQTDVTLLSSPSYYFGQKEAEIPTETLSPTPKTPWLVTSMNSVPYEKPQILEVETTNNENEVPEVSVTRFVFPASPELYLDSICPRIVPTCPNEDEASDDEREEPARTPVTLTEDFPVVLELSQTVVTESLEPCEDQAIEYLLLLRKPSLSTVATHGETSDKVQVTEDLQLSADATTQDEVKPSVRALRSRFESAPSAASSVDGEPKSAPALSNQRETLKQKLHALSDMYRDASPPLANAETVKPESPPRMLKSSNLNIVIGSPILPMKPSYVIKTSGTLPGASKVTVCAAVTEPPSWTTRRASVDKDKSDTISITSTSSCGSTKDASVKVNKVSQICQMYETATTTTPTAIPTEADCRVAKKTDSLPRPHSSAFRQYLSSV